MSPARRPVGLRIDVWHTHRLRPLAIPPKEKNRCLDMPAECLLL